MTDELSQEAAPLQRRRDGQRRELCSTGRSKAWERVADSGHKATYQFCHDCGSTIAYIIEGWPGVVAVPVGAFADPTFPAPKFSVYEHRKHPWVVVLGEAVEHSSTPRVLRNPGS
jgi:hypothetical protein